MDNEIWKDIPDYEGLYEASSLGRIRSKEGRVSYRKYKSGKIFEFNHKKGTMLKAKLRSGNYYQVDLYNSSGECSTKYIHRIIAITFVLNPEGKAEVNHIDGNRTNNCYSNLGWVTPSENIRHAIDMGLTTNNKEVVLYANEETIVFNTMARCNRFLGRGSAYLTQRIVYKGLDTVVSVIDNKTYKVKITSKRGNE